MGTSLIPCIWESKDLIHMVTLHQKDGPLAKDRPMLVRPMRKGPGIPQAIVEHLKFF